MIDPLLLSVPMPRRRPALSPVDPPPDALTIAQLISDGVAHKAEAMRFLGCSGTRLKELVRNKAFASWEEGRNRVYPRVGLRAYLATCAREEGINDAPLLASSALRTESPPVPPDLADSLASLHEKLLRIEVALRPEGSSSVADGAMSVKQAMAFTGDSRTRLFQLMEAGVLEWFSASRDRRITRKSLTEYLARTLQQHEPDKRKTIPRSKSKAGVVAT